MLRKCIFILTMTPLLLFSNNIDMIDDIFKLDLKSLTNFKINTVSKMEQSVIDTPANIVIVTKEQIQKRGYRHLGDLLKDTAGFNVIDFANSGTITRTGIHGTIDQEYFKILKDGIDISNANYGSLPTSMNYPLFGIERVEILIGGASVVYGADAVSGVVNLVTNEEYGLSSKVSLGTKGYKYADLRYALKLNENKFIVNAHIHTDQEYNFAKLYPNDFPKVALMLGDEVIQSADDRDFNYKPFNTKSISFLLKNKAWSFGGYFNTTEESTYISFTGYDTEKQLAQDGSNMIHEARGLYFKHNHKFTENLNLTSTINYNATELLADSYYINLYSNYEEAYKYSFSETITIDEIVNYSIDNHSMLLGLSASHIYSIPKSVDLNLPFLDESQTYSGSDIPINLYRESSVNYAIFLQDQIRFSESWQLSVAGRYSFNDTYADNFVPRVALIYKSNANTTHKFIYSRSFLAPSPSSKYRNYGVLFKENDGTREGDTNKYQIDYARIANPNLEAIEGENLEYVLSKWINNNFLLSSTIYSNKIKNEIDSISIYNLEGIYEDTTILKAKQSVNDSKSVMYGGDISLLYKGEYKNSEIEGWINYSYIDGYEEDNGQKKELSFIKPHTLNFGGTLSYNNFDITPSFKWVKEINTGVDSSEDSTLKVKADGYFVANLFTKYKYSNDLELMLNIKNLLDKRYYEVRRTGSSNNKSPQAERLTIASMKYRF